MNLRAYFQKIREVEKSILDDVVCVSSLATDEGGIAGIISQVTRLIAAKLIVEQRSRLATDEEVASLLARQEAARQKLHDEQISQRLQVSIVSDRNIEALRGSGGGSKKASFSVDPAAIPEKTEKKKD